jgi:hypothetical protein
VVGGDRPWAFLFCWPSTAAASRTAEQKG